MPSLEELRARMDRLGERLSEIEQGGKPDDAARTNMREIVDRHASLRVRIQSLGPAPSADKEVERQVDELLNAFDRWATQHDKEFGQR